MDIGGCFCARWRLCRGVGVRQDAAYLLFGLLGIGLIAAVWLIVRLARRRDSSIKVDLFNKRDR